MEATQPFARRANLRQQVPFLLLAASVAGAAMQLRQAALWPWPAYAALLLAAWAMGLAQWRLQRRPHGAPAALVLLLAVACGLGLGAGSAGLRACAYAAGALDPVLEGQALELTGRVAAMPQVGEGATRFRFEPLSMRLLDAGRPGAPAPRMPSAVSLSWYGASDGKAAVQVGERWRLPVRLRAPHGALNPHGFDAELRAWEQGVRATGHVRADAAAAPPERLGRDWRHPVERARGHVRDAILASSDDARAAGVVAALVTGDQAAIADADWDVFRATGVAHLMAISGLHVTMFAWLARAAFGALWRRSARLVLCWPAQHAGLAGGIVLAGCYAVFSGWGVPAQRTVWMLCVVGLLRLSGRQWPWPWVWLAAAAVVVAVDPWALLQAGFWLSFVAVGVLFASGRAAAPESPRWWHPAARLWREQLVVTLALTPLVLLLFQQVSLVGLVANALAIPWVTLVVTPLAMAGVAWAPLWTLAVVAVSAIVRLLQALAALDFASVSLAAPPPWLALAAMAGGLLLVLRLPWRLRGLGLPLLLPVCLWTPPRPLPGEFELLGMDVGQGTAVLVRTARHSLLYDAGPAYFSGGDAGDRIVVPLLRALGERLDVLLLSHRDADHTGGAPAVLAMQPQARLLASLEPGHALEALRPVEPCVAGHGWQWDGVRFDILHPPAGDAAPGARANARSCVLRISNGRAAALLTGDIERLQELGLVLRQRELRADFLLVPHHGSKTSSSAALLQAVQPRVALAQAGYRNRFGHPAEEVAARYRVQGVPLAASPACGAAGWSSREPARLACHRHLARRYWHHRMPPS